MADDSSGGPGHSSVDAFVDASSDYACARGTRGKLALSFPRDTTMHGPLAVDLTCPCCGEPVVIPGNLHYVNAAGVLVSE
jgi:hypothetical protein